MRTAKYVIDTHALIWYLEGNTRLGEQARQILANTASQLLLPAIVLAEAMWIVEKGRTSIPSVTALLAAVKADPRIDIVELDATVVTKTKELITINEMHDRQIVATVLTLQDKAEVVTLISWDQNITESGLVEVIW
ncbi:MAG: type II toxin-antitoxin system VapC family toxin [Leptolyngbyaceae cyanobacterium SM2_5_2]|nr:type II toxin-antitoxin system VapC family toxin [Leptolyngbyaceae cyanobacterium SM2_5_2]